MKQVIVLIVVLALANALVPKQVVKHGLVTFIKEIAEPSESNVCFLFFEKIVEAILDDKKDFDEAIGEALQQDFTHASVKGRCSKTYKVVMDKFQSHGSLHSKVSAIDLESK